MSVEAWLGLAVCVALAVIACAPLFMPSVAARSRRTQVPFGTPTIRGRKIIPPQGGSGTADAKSRATPRTMWE